MISFKTVATPSSCNETEIDEDDHDGDDEDDDDDDDNDDDEVRSPRMPAGKIAAHLLLPLTSQDWKRLHEYTDEHQWATALSVCATSLPLFFLRTDVDVCDERDTQIGRTDDPTERERDRPIKFIDHNGSGSHPSTTSFRVRVLFIISLSALLKANALGGG